MGLIDNDMSTENENQGESVKRGMPENALVATLHDSAVIHTHVVDTRMHS